MSRGCGGRGRRRRRYVTILAMVLVAGMATWWFALRHAGVPEHRQDGRSIAAWLDDLVRTAPNLHRDTDLGRHHEARAALIEAGDAAVPMLVKRLGKLPRQTALRGLLRQAAKILDQPGDRQWFADPEAAALAILDVLREIDPPPAVLGSLASSPGLLNQRIADQDDLVDALIEWLAMPDTARNRAVAGLWVRRLPEIAPDGASRILRALEKEPGNPRWIRLLAVYGTNAAAAVPFLRGQLGDVAPSRSVVAALSLLEIAPTETQAMEVVRLAAQKAAFDPWNQLSADGMQLCDQAVLWFPNRHPAAVLALESLARQETEQWEPRGLAQIASAAFEAIAPERAAPLYAAQMVATNRETVRIVAAGSLLRVDRKHGGAVALLTNFVAGGGHLSAMASSQLQEADASFLPELAALFGADADSLLDSWTAGRLNATLRRLESRWREDAAGGRRRESLRRPRRFRKRRIRANEVR